MPSSSAASQVVRRPALRGEGNLELEAGLLSPAVEYVFSLHTTAKAETDTDTEVVDVNKWLKSTSVPTEETFVMVPPPPRELTDLLQTHQIRCPLYHAASVCQTQHN